MRHRLPLVLSALALVVSLLGATSAGDAAVGFVRGVVPPLALYANNAGKLGGHTASTAPVGGQIPSSTRAGTCRRPRSAARPASTRRRSRSSRASRPRSRWGTRRG